MHLVTISILKPAYHVSGRVFPPKNARNWRNDSRSRKWL